MSAVCISAPGKVLIAGGYLVLDPQYPGLVIATSSRFHVVIAEGSAQAESNVIEVHSPQFLNASWTYKIDDHTDGVKVQELHDRNPQSSPNKFVYLAVQRVIAYAALVKSAQFVQDKLSKGLKIVIAGDNDFYSQRAKLKALGLPPTTASLHQLPPLGPTGTTLRDVHKTGLGSSAALITALVTALLVQFSVISKTALAQDDVRHPDLTIAHNISQYVHCYAQGKIGSGFDVSSAIYGSHVYTRFDPQILKPIMEDQFSPTTLTEVLSASNDGWNCKVEPVTLPPRMKILLADVDAGSDTPSLVGKVLKWRQQNKDEAESLWNAIDSNNRSLHTGFRALSQFAAANKESYENLIAKAVMSPARDWPQVATASTEQAGVLNGLIALHDTTERIRKNMRHMGELADVPIEPLQQTRLLDLSTAVPGVVGGGVPGAGGFDAIWLLVLETADGTVEKAVQTVWSTIYDMSVTPLLARESLERGVRSEDWQRIPGLGEILSRFGIRS
ncbi:Phosphomevalonate kinase [Sistotremastrum niveocremeum HHB9708]|uniref:Phosphomevalonate kinase n=1 Tax=Sistotremastrum niveocremeum HHB9708 TaxID=1314777 RepID=A0A165A141_9AGAM|nr:Phosphomevalonate kinase [Sistotremastrum niveocremeum HHB9708]